MRLALASIVIGFQVEAPSTFKVDVVEMAVVRASIPVSPVKVALVVTVTKLAAIGAYLAFKAVPPSEIEAKAAAPAPVTLHWASFKTRSDPDDAPIVMVPPVELPTVMV